MATKRLADVAIDRSKSYERKLRESEDVFKKRSLDEDQYSRTVEIAINLYNYIQNTPGMNRALLAEKLNVSQSYLCNLINGKLNPSIKTIEKYERILSIKLLPVSNETDKAPIISSLPSIKMMSTAYYNDFSEDTNRFNENADRIQIFAY